MLLGNTERYPRIAILAVALFLVFDFSALALNIWLSSKIEKQAIAINLAGRQRMLSQRMAKVILQLEDVAEGERQPSALLDELRLTYELFDSTLLGFSQGYLTRGGANEELFLEAVQGSKAKALVAQAMTIWAPYRNFLLAVLQSNGRDSLATLKSLAAYSEQHNLELLGLMNSLTSELEWLTQREASQIRVYQSAAFVLALLNFFGAFLLYNHRMHLVKSQHNLLDEIIQKVPACVMVLDEDALRIAKANRMSEQLFGYAPGELVGMQIGDLLTNREGEQVGHRKDGTTFMAHNERSETFWDGRKLFIETVVDVTQQHNTEKHLSRLAYHDHLTRLPNRLLFDDRLDMEIAHTRRRNCMFGVLFIDLDRFKAVNDTYGHDIGDLLLQEVAISLQRCLRESDTLSRRGGDEFTAIISDVGNREDCAKVAQSMIAQFASPFYIQGLELRLNVSIGISVFPYDGHSAPLLVSHADDAMYHAKQQGGGVYCFYYEALSGKKP